MNYFLKENRKINKYKIIINKRRRRKIIINIPILKNIAKFFNIGDIITITYWTKTILCYYEGICLGLKNKFFKKPRVNFILRNVLSKIGIEINISYFINRIFKNILMSDYKRKRIKYRSSKLYYLRLKKNKASKIKGWI